MDEPSGPRPWDHHAAEHHVRGSVVRPRATIVAVRVGTHRYPRRPSDRLEPVATVSSRVQEDGRIRSGWSGSGTSTRGRGRLQRDHAA